MRISQPNEEDLPAVLRTVTFNVKNINTVVDLLSDAVIPDSEEGMPGYYLVDGDTVRIETMEIATALVFARNVMKYNIDEYFGIFLHDML